jgi:hypothetical protein
MDLKLLKILDGGALGQLERGPEVGHPGEELIRRTCFGNHNLATRFFAISNGGFEPRTWTEQVIDLVVGSRKITACLQSAPICS